MARDDAAIRLTVAQRQALAALNQFQNKFAQMTQSMSSNTRRQARESKKTNTILSSWGGSIKTAGLAMVGFGSATSAAYTIVSLVRKELDVIDNTLGRMKDRQLDFAQATMQVGFSLPNKDDGLIDMNIDEISERLSQGTYDPAQAMRVFRNIHGANADLSLSGKAEITESLMNKRFDLSEDAMTELGVQIADNHAKAIAKGVESSVDAQMGLFEGTKAASKVTDDAKFYGNIAPIGLDLSKFGVNQGESMLLAASLSSAANDRTGEETRTALSKLFSTLEEEKVRFGIEESGFGLLKAVREGKSQKHKDFQKYLLGVFADGEDKNFLEMTRSEAALKLEGRSKMKFYLMDLLRQKTDDPSNLQNVMGTIKSSGQIPLSYKGDTFQVDMNKTMEASAQYFADKLEQIMKNKRVGMFIEKKYHEKTSADLEMGNIEGATQKMRQEAVMRMLENAGVPMAEMRANIDFYTGRYGKEGGLLAAAKHARRNVIVDHPNHGMFSKTMLADGTTWQDASRDGKRIEDMSIEQIKTLRYQRTWSMNRDERSVSDQQIKMIEAIDRFTETIQSGGLRKVEVTNMGSVNQSTGAKQLGE